MSSSFFEKVNLWMKKSIMLKIFTIGILILLLLIPLNFVQNLIREREYRQDEAIREVSSIWGHEQTVTAIVMTIPYNTFSKVYDQDEKDKYSLVKNTHYAHFLPNDLKINGQVAPELRYRGIFEVVVYNSKLAIEGSFKKPDFSQWNIEQENIRWEDASIALGLTDLRGVQETVSIEWEDQPYAFNPGVGSAEVISAGMNTKVPLEKTIENDELYSFSVQLDFNGSSGLNFIPLGKTTEVKLDGNWKDPSFDGAFFPDSRNISAETFDAVWKVLHLNRTYPQSFIGSIQGIQQSAFGVKLLKPVDEYQKSMRSAKYAVMFIGLTFLIFFFVQILNKTRIHPIQYLMVGLGLVLFYTLLVSLSEHIPFKWSYLISSVAIITMITAYTKTIFKTPRLTMIMGAILIVLYIFIFTIIQLQDYALLMGSIGLFITLAVVMYLSRKIDWYNA